MIKKLLPVIMIVVGLGGGVGAGFALKPASHAGDCPAPDAMGADGQPAPAHGEGSDASGHGAADADPCAEAPAEAEHHDDDSLMAGSEFVPLNRQFVVPVIKDGEVSALVVASLALDVDEGLTDTILKLEPKLRDAFLQVMFVHSHSGGFDAEFTSPHAMADLRGRLLEAGQEVLGSALRDVLITEVVRQDT